MRNSNCNYILCFDIIIVVIALLLVIGPFILSSTNCSLYIDPEFANQYGGFVGGVAGPLASLVSAVLLFYTLKEQRRQFTIQQFETNLFELIRLHRENVNLLKDRNPYTANRISEGRDVFIDLKKACGDLIIKTSTHFKDNKYITERDSINIAYITFYLGVGERTKEMLMGQLEKLETEKSKEIDKVLIEKYVRVVSEEKLEYDCSTVFYGGHQSKLGHYFRHIYRTIMFIDESGFLSEQEKKNYTKLIRSQLTTYEQSILFYHSISPLGIKWCELIKKYELIKNIPPQFLNNIKVNDYYPNISYEFEM